MCILWQMYLCTSHIALLSFAAFLWHVRQKQFCDITYDKPHETWDLHALCHIHYSNTQLQWTALPASSHKFWCCMRSKSVTSNSPWNLTFSSSSPSLKASTTMWSSRHKSIIVRVADLVIKSDWLGLRSPGNYMTLPSYTFIFIILVIVAIRHHWTYQFRCEENQIPGHLWEVRDCAS